MSEKTFLGFLLSIPSIMYSKKLYLDCELLSTILSNAARILPLDFVLDRLLLVTERTRTRSHVVRLASEI